MFNENYRCNKRPPRQGTSTLEVDQTGKSLLTLHGAIRLVEPVEKRCGAAVAKEKIEERSGVIISFRGEGLISLIQERS